MNKIPSLSELNINQKDALILILWEENQAFKAHIVRLEEQIKDLKVQVDELRAENVVLRAENVVLRAENVALRAENAALKAENADLRSKLNRNSRNSHQPPSKDNFKKSLRTKSDKPSGGQTGHMGKSLQESDSADRQVKHLVKKCPHCFFNIEEVNNLRWKKAQVFDIAPLKIEVEEHLVEEKICPHCQHLCSAVLPLGLRFGTQYGNRILALSTYLHDYHYLSSNRVSEFFQDIFNHTLSEGTVFNAEKTCFSSLKDFEESLKDALKKCRVAHVDETVLRAQGKNCYLHVFSTLKSSFFSIHPKRGRAAMEYIGILPSFKGTLIHDHYSSYFIYGFNHALCNAHHLRELQGVFETTNHSWATQMSDLLKNIKKDKEAGHLSFAKIKAYDKEYDENIDLGYKQLRSPPFVISRPKESCLLHRLRHFKTWTLLFMHEENVPFDNNLAERDIRMMKLKMKISGCFRSQNWTPIFCRIRSYISTIRKNGMAVFKSLVDAFDRLSPTFLASIQYS